MTVLVDRVVLLEPSGTKHLVNLDRETLNIPGVGVARSDTLRASIGRRWTVGGRAFLVLTASVRDKVGGVRRQAQIVGPKDLSSLVWNSDLKAGDFVVEAGAGSGALTLALGHAVGPGGRVVTYDLRPDFLDVARENVTVAGLEGRVEFKVGDVRAGIPEQDADAFVLDIPDPWAAVGTVAEALRPCGHLATFSPNMEQVKETVLAIRARPFVDVRTIEIIEREMEVRDVGVRPSFAALGHTGYLTFARKVLETF